MDASGLVTIIGANGPFVSNEAEITSVTPAQVGIGSLVTSILSVAETPQNVWVDLGTRKVISAGAIYGPLQPADLLNGVTHKKQVLKPVANSEGKSVQWEETSRTAGMTAALPNAIKASVDATRPYRSLASLISTIASKVEDAAEKPIIYVDQTNGEVHVITNIGDRGAFNDGVGDFETNTSDTAEALALALTEPASQSGGNTALKFEGGAF